MSIAHLFCQNNVGEKVVLKASVWITSWGTPLIRTLNQVIYLIDAFDCQDRTPF